MTLARRLVRFRTPSRAIGGIGHGETCSAWADGGGVGDGALDRSVRVFALGHTAIAVNTPDTDSDQHNPGDLPLLDEEARDVALALDNLIVALTVCHDAFRESLSPGRHP